MTTIADRLTVQTALLTEIRDLLAGQSRSVTSIHESGLRADVESITEAFNRGIAKTRSGAEDDGLAGSGEGDRDCGTDDKTDGATAEQVELGDSSAGRAQPLDEGLRLSSVGPFREGPGLPGVVQLHVHVHTSPSSVADTPEARPAPAPASADPVAELEGDLRAAQLHDLGQAGTARYLVFQGWRRA